jgi:hypothetical protein
MGDGRFRKLNSKYLYNAPCRSALSKKPLGATFRQGNLDIMSASVAHRGYIGVICFAGC